MMVNKKGFTLIELMVAIAIIGILAASAIPFYSTYRQRARSSEALVMLKQLANAEIAYFLEHNEFYPPVGETYQIYTDSTDPDTAVEDVASNLNITIPQEHSIDYTLRQDDDSGQKSVMIYAYPPVGRSFYNASALLAIVDQNGNVNIGPM